MNSENPSQYQIVVAGPDWKPTKIIVADAFILGGEVRLEPRDGMYVEDEDGLKEAITAGHNRFQAAGHSFCESCKLPQSPHSDDTTRINAWRYFIVPVA
jgi:hypothetical protein